MKSEPTDIRKTRQAQRCRQRNWQLHKNFPAVFAGQQKAAAGRERISPPAAAVLFYLFYSRFLPLFFSIP